MRFYSLVLLATVYQSISVFAAPVSSEVNSLGTHVNHGQVARRRLHRRASKLRDCVTRACQQAYRGLDNGIGRTNQAFARHAAQYPNIHRAAVGLGKGVNAVGAGVAGNTIAALGVNEYLNRKDEQTKLLEPVQAAPPAPQTNVQPVHIAAPAPAPQTTIKPETKVAPKAPVVPAVKPSPVAAAPKTASPKAATPGQAKN